MHSATSPATAGCPTATSSCGARTKRGPSASARLRDHPPGDSGRHGGGRRPGRRHRRPGFRAGEPRRPPERPGRDRARRADGPSQLRRQTRVRGGLYLDRGPFSATSPTRTSSNSTTTRATAPIPRSPEARAVCASPSASPPSLAPSRASSTAPSASPRRTRPPSAPSARPLPTTSRGCSASPRRAEQGPRRRQVLRH